MWKKLIIGNWKLNGSLAANKQRFNAVASTAGALTDIDIGICVPYPYLFQAQQCLSCTPIKWGAQNVSQFAQGAYTSCVSAEMVAEFGTTYALLGHSERRFYTDESSHKAVLRIKRAADAGITPIYCIGETLEEHQTGHAKDVIDRQLQPLFELDVATFSRAKAVGLVIAYEPVWAIGADIAATPKQAQIMHAYIRDLMAARDVEFATRMRILYGGSLKPENAASMFAMPDIDGGLVGRASLNPERFGQICAQLSNQHRSNQHHQ